MKQRRFKKYNVMFTRWELLLSTHNYDERAKNRFKQIRRNMQKRKVSIIWKRKMNISLPKYNKMKILIKY